MKKNRLNDLWDETLFPMLLLILMIGIPSGLIIWICTGIYSLLEKLIDKI